MERAKTKPSVFSDRVMPVPEGIGLFRHQRTGGGQRRQPVLSIVFQASMALCRSIRRQVWGTGGLGGIQL